MSNDRLVKEIHDLIDHRLESGRPVEINLVVNEIKDKHRDCRGADAVFYISLAEDTLIEFVKACIGRFKPKAQHTDEQLLFPGFVHLQKAYPVARNGKHYLMPVQAMTATERDVRANEYEKMGDGCYEHANELRSFAVVYSGKGIA